MSKKDDIQIDNTEEIKNLEGRVASLEDLLKRAVADYQNLEKRVHEDSMSVVNRSRAELLKKMVPVLDHLEAALNGADEEDRQSGWLKGVELAVKELNQVLSSEGLGRIEADGQFDPSLHEAVDTMEGENNKILKVVGKGYTLDGRVIRPAAVVVGKKGDK